MNIQATDVTKTYGDVTALDGLSLSVPAGSTYGLLGTNGAGKTTLFRLLIGHEEPDSGAVRLGDTTVAAAGPPVRQRVGYLPERVGFPDELTAREVLTLTARVRGFPDVDERIASVLETVGLGMDADRPVSGFSNGMRRRLGLATALLPDPDVLLLDEPTAGLDPLGVVSFHRIVEDVSERTGATVLVCSHALGEVERLCDRAAILDGGRLRASGPLDELTGEAPDTRTVRVRCADDTRRATVSELCGRYGEPRVRGDAVAVSVPTDELRTLLDEFDDAVGLDGVEFGTRKLEETFTALVSDEAGAAGGSARGPTTDDQPAVPQEGPS